MQEIKKATLVADDGNVSGLLGKIAPLLAIAALVGLAGAFWAANGATVFAELISSAWALCF